jgi:hypothetical protein
MLVYDPPKPGREGSRLTQFGQRTIRIEEGFLRGILGKMIVAEERRGIGHGEILKARDEGCERLFVSRLRGANDLFELRVC